LENEKILLTSFSKNAGCSCKIAPKMLQEILQQSSSRFAEVEFPNLLVGNESADDAAVYDLGNGTSLISTTDFFTPVVNDAFDFGRIAAANAISDVYAMGGKPLMALAILGFPTEKISPQIAQQILAGARAVCAEANIPLSGGHSIDIAEPIFGLAVSGLVENKNLLRNNTVQVGDWLYLTKPLGLGVLTSAEKKGLLSEDDYKTAVHWMTQLNKFGEELHNIGGITALTDVTGFGLAGHLVEMCDKKRLTAELFWNNIPILNEAKNLAAKGVRPDATSRNWNSFGEQIQCLENVPMMDAFNFLPDPQTSGGLLIAVNDVAKNHFEEFLKNKIGEQFAKPIGRMIEPLEKTIIVK
jgi:selenide, water dikinase